MDSSSIGPAVERLKQPATSAGEHHLIATRAGAVQQPTDSTNNHPDEAAFDRFMARQGATLKRVLFAHFGFELGPEAFAEATAYAWEHWGRVSRLANPVGYLYRVAQSSMRRQYRWRRLHPDLAVPAAVDDPAMFVEPELATALSRLPASQRTAVVLVHGLGWTLSDAAGALGVSVSTLRNHLRRGRDALRRALGE